MCEVTLHGGCHFVEYVEDGVVQEPWSRRVESLSRSPVICACLGLATGDRCGAQNYTDLTDTFSLQVDMCNPVRLKVFTIEF